MQSPKVVTSPFIVKWQLPILRQTSRGTVLRQITQVYRMESTWLLLTPQGIMQGNIIVSWTMEFTGRWHQVPVQLMCSVSNLLSFILARWDWELIWKIEEFFDRIVSRSSSIYESSCFKYLEKPLDRLPFWGWECSGGLKVSLRSNAHLSLPCRSLKTATYVFALGTLSLG